MILLGLQVSIGQLLTLRNSKTSEEVLNRVAYVSPHQREATFHVRHGSSAASAYPYAAIAEGPAFAR
jgi:hypothetical protein